MPSVWILNFTQTASIFWNKITYKNRSLGAGVIFFIIPQAICSTSKTLLKSYKIDENQSITLKYINILQNKKNLKNYNDNKTQ